MEQNNYIQSNQNKRRKPLIFQCTCTNFIYWMIVCTGRWKSVGPSSKQVNWPLLFHLLRGPISALKNQKMHTATDKIKATIRTADCSCLGRRMHVAFFGNNEIGVKVKTTIQGGFFDYLFIVLGGRDCRADCYVTYQRSVIVKYEYEKYGSSEIKTLIIVLIMTCWK